jgi:hypothetical protein
MQPTLAERAGTYVPNAVKAYAPAGFGASGLGAGVAKSEHDHEHTESILTAEVTGAGTGEHVGGTGVLPGSTNESGAVLVPASASVSRHRSGAVWRRRRTSCTVPTTSTRPLVGLLSHSAQACTHRSRSRRRYCDRHGRYPAPHNEPAEVGDRWHPHGRVDRRRLEGNLSVSAAMSGKTERDHDVAGLRDVSNRKLHGGVPSDIGGGAMPFRDSHEGGPDALDTENTGGQHRRTPRTGNYSLHGVCCRRSSMQRVDAAPHTVRPLEGN